MFHVPITCKYTFIKPSIFQSTAFFLLPSTRETRTNKRNTQVGGTCSGFGIDGMHGWTPVGCALEEEERKRSGGSLWKQLGDVDETIAFTTESSKAKRRSRQDDSRYLKQQRNESKRRQENSHYWQNQQWRNNMCCNR